MFCSQCGNTITPTDQFCPRCGKPNEMPAQAGQNDSTASAGSQNFSNGTAYTRDDYNPAQPAQTASSNAAVNPARKGVTASIVLSIVNILLVGFGISTILGIVALIYTILATTASDNRGFQTKMSAARALNLFGLVMIVLQIVVIAGIIIAVFN